MMMSRNAPLMTCAEIRPWIMHFKQAVEARAIELAKKRQRSNAVTGIMDQGSDTRRASVSESNPHAQGEFK